MIAAANSIMLIWLVAGGSLLLMIWLLATSGKSAVERRVAELSLEQSGQMATAPAAQFGAGRSGTIVKVDNPIEGWTARTIRKQEKKHDLRERMMQAGLYTPNAARVFLVLRLLLLVGPSVLGFLAGRMGYLEPVRGAFLGGVAGLLGTMAPIFWIDQVKRSRQTKVRRALPDALDVMVVCLQGGLSLPGAMARVARELAMAHPLLAVELNIVERHIRMGRSTGEAVREMAARFDIEELRSMASVLIQAERIGSSVANTLELFADSLRLKRQQRAEEMAHEASVKMLFPTLLFIFPAIFVVILGPAAIQIYEQLLSGAMRGGH
jgi:tight adherence protein C